MSIKMLREDLCKQQTYPRCKDWPKDVHLAVGALINIIDEHRPLGPDGKHGNLHTPTCGCQDKVL